LSRVASRADEPATRPTEAELAILAVLWQLGPATVRQVHEQLGRATGYTTVLKLMQIMTEKGLLVRDERSRTHVYRAAVPQERTQRKLVGDLLHRAFGGSVRKLLVAALSDQRASPQELDEIRKLIDEHAQPRRKRSRKSDTSEGGDS
jgi:predicted transcriptional regulator